MAVRGVPVELLGLTDKKKSTDSTTTLVVSMVTVVVSVLFIVPVVEAVRLPMVVATRLPVAPRFVIGAERLCRPPNAGPNSDEKRI